MPASFDFRHAPGHLIRRAQQIAVAQFARETAAFGITPVQFALLQALVQSPGVDQNTLAAQVAFDPATSGSVVGRLEAKGWIRREADPQDRRRKLLHVTPQGLQALQDMQAAVRRVQQQILAPLTPSQAQQLVDLLASLVAGHEDKGEGA